MLEEPWRNVSLHKCPTTQILAHAVNIFKAIYKPTNNLIMSHQEKVHWTLDTHQGTQNKKKGCQRSISFWVQNPYYREVVTLRNSPVKLTFIRIKKGTLQYKCGEQKLLGP